MRARFVLCLLGAVAGIAALNAQSPLPEGTWRLENSPSELRDATGRASAVVAEVHGVLLRELRSALAQGGPDMAMYSCHIDVIGALRREGLQPGVDVGRTSHRLRSRTNAPPEWAVSIVREYAGRMAGEVQGFVVDLDTKVGVLRSIAHQAECVACHGPVESMAPGVRTALAVRYPADRATGFKEGEIRGWYWVEVRKAPGKSGR